MNQFVDLNYSAWFIVKFAKSIAWQVPQDPKVGATRSRRVYSSGYRFTWAMQTSDKSPTSSAAKKCSQSIGTKLWCSFCPKKTSALLRLT